MRRSRSCSVGGAALPTTCSHWLRHGVASAHWLRVRRELRQPRGPLKAALQAGEAAVAGAARDEAEQHERGTEAAAGVGRRAAGTAREGIQGKICPRRPSHLRTASIDTLARR